MEVIVEMKNMTEPARVDEIRNSIRNGGIDPYAYAHKPELVEYRSIEVKGFAAILRKAGV